MRSRTKLHIPGTEIRIGDLVKDELSGFEGIVTSHARHLTGCDTAYVVSRDLKQKDSVEPEARWLDVMTLALMKSNPMKVEGFPDEETAGG